MTEVERVLDLLVHDLRTPLGVAQGYLRLVRQQRLPSPEERDHALGEAQRALAQVARLCDDAASFLADGDGAAAEQAKAALLIGRVFERLRAAGVSVADAPVAPQAALRVGTSLDRLSDAVATLLASTSRGARQDPPIVRAEADGAELRFTASRHDGRAASPVEPFDPWHGYGLAVPLACRVVAGAGGRIQGAPRTAGTLAIVFPLEIVSE